MPVIREAPIPDIREAPMPDAVDDAADRWFRDETPGRAWRSPGLAWDLVREVSIEGRPGTEVPAELAALDPRARALLVVRLGWRCGASEVRILPGEVTTVVLVGLPPARLTPELRAAAAEALGSVSADAAAGWTAADEIERHVPFSWG